MTDSIRAPRQARSQDSTARLLDAALKLLDGGGLPALTIAAVSRESGMSNGAIYHRFGDRHGLLVAAQDRFLGRLQDAWTEALGAIWPVNDRAKGLTSLVDAFLGIFAEHRGLFNAFMVTGHDDPELRARGEQASRAAAWAIIGELTRQFGCTPQAAATAYRILFAEATLGAFFADEEVEPVGVDPPARRRYLVRAVTAVLTE